MEIDDEEGVVVLLRTEIAESERDRAESAASSCPVSALTITER